MRHLRLTLALLTALACTRATQDAGMVLNIDTDATIDKSAITTITVTVDGKADTWVIGHPLPGNLGIVTSAGSKSVVVEGVANTSTVGRWSGTIAVSKGKVTTQDVRLTCVICSTPDGGLPPVDGSAGGTTGMGGVTGNGGTTGTGGMRSSGETGGLLAIDAGAGGAGNGGTTGNAGTTGTGGMRSSGGAGGLTAIDAGVGGATSAGGATGAGGASNIGGSTGGAGVTGSGGTVSGGAAGGVGGTVSSGGPGARAAEGPAGRALMRECPRVARPGPPCSSPTSTTVRLAD